MCHTDAPGNIARGDGERIGPNSHSSVRLGVEREKRIQKLGVVNLANLTSRMRQG